MHDATAIAAWKNAHIMTNSETLLLLQRRIKQNRDKNPAYEAPGVMARTLEYLQRFSTTQNEENMQEIRKCEQMLRAHAACCVLL